MHKHTYLRTDAFFLRSKRSSLLVHAANARDPPPGEHAWNDLVAESRGEEALRLWRDHGRAAATPLIKAQASATSDRDLTSRMTYKKCAKTIAQEQSVKSLKTLQF